MVAEIFDWLDVRLCCFSARTRCTADSVKRAENDNAQIASFGRVAQTCSRFARVTEVAIERATTDANCDR
jgi:hypothetical protein